MARQAEMFAKPAAVQRVRRAHCTDSGAFPDGRMCAYYECSRCGWKSDWIGAQSVSEAKRGVPCGQCNNLEK